MEPTRRNPAVGRGRAPKNVRIGRQDISEHSLTRPAGQRSRWLAAVSNGVQLDLTGFQPISIFAARIVASLPNRLEAVL